MSEVLNVLDASEMLEVSEVTEVSEVSEVTELTEVWEGSEVSEVSESGLCLPVIIWCGERERTSGRTVTDLTVEPGQCWDTLSLMSSRHILIRESNNVNSQ